MTKKPVLLCILDGWGIGDENNKNNAIAQAKTPNYSRFINSYPNSQLKTSGIDVGLPDGQIGNSEVGHMTIGAGRIVFQDFPRINNAISDGSFEKNKKLQNLITNLKSSGKTCHLAGLFSDGGVHSHIDHIIFLAKLLEKNGVKVAIHAFLDGRDVAQKSAISYFENNSDLNIATITGRYFAMDRDYNWSRIKLAFDAIISGIGEKFVKPKDAIEKSYENNITDEFVKPCIIGNYNGVNEGDALIFCNFRADRVRQISHALLDKNFDKFERKNNNSTNYKGFSQALCFTQYSEELNKLYGVLFLPTKIKNSLPEILEENNLTQLRIAETEKFAHVTFFFSCKKEDEFKGEKRILIQSPNVATYDLKPEMSASEVGKNLCNELKNFDFVIVNYANPDMVGHSGILEASIAACEKIDEELGLLEKEILKLDGQMLITADHGNIEEMIDDNSNPHTSHTTNPVPFILVSNNSKRKLANGRLSDIAPTILGLMNLKKPSEMDGKNLIY
jgi:2,3-bisphosphoglycerate-independent phosphoglycerate mutase